MAPKIDPNEVKIIYLRAVGGEVGASSALAPKIGEFAVFSSLVIKCLHVLYRSTRSCELELLYADRYSNTHSSHQRRLVKISPRHPVIGRDCVLPFNSPSKTVKLKSLSFLQLPHWSLEL